MAQVGSFTVAITALGGGRNKVSIAWTASAGGAVSGAGFQLPGGHIEQVKFVSGSTGYTATLVDADGLDLLMGKGGSLSANAIAVPVVSSVAPVYNDATIGSPVGEVTPTIASGGAAGTGRIDLIMGP